MQVAMVSVRCVVFATVATTHLTAAYEIEKSISRLSSYVNVFIAQTI